MARSKRRLKGVTQDDVITIVENATSRACEKKWKTKQYVPICKKAAETFLEEVGKAGTSRKGIIHSANVVTQMCVRDYKTPQYFRICERAGAGILRALIAKRPGLEGRRR